MDIGVMLDVAIGIIFVWIVLSLSTIQIQEWITTALDKRAKDMEDAIHEMLANPNLKDQFYEHPVIRGLTARKRSEPSRIPAWFYRYPILRGFTKEKRKLPSYIPSQQFALALFDIAITANTESSLIQQGILKLRDDLKEARSKMTVQQAVIEELNLLSEFARSAAATEAGTAITKKTIDQLRIKAEHFVEDLSTKYPQLKLDENMVRVLQDGIDTALKEATRLKNEMDEVVKLQPKLDAGAALTRVRRGVAALSVISPEVHQSLSALLMNVEEYAADKEKLLATARGNVEKWFNDSMDRVSGVFKRYSQTMALLIGLVLALLLNLDSIDLTIFLWRDPSVRQVLAARAAQLESIETGTGGNPQETYEVLNAQLQDLNLPVGWGITDNNGAGNCALFPGDEQSFGIPVVLTSKCLSTPQPTNQTNILVKLVGIVITALAARLGAPFWFDVLKRAVNLRGTGANPAEKERK